MFYFIHVTDGTMATANDIFFIVVIVCFELEYLLSCTVYYSFNCIINNITRAKTNIPNIRIRIRFDFVRRNY